MINFRKSINKILKFDHLYYNINLNKFNNEEKELLKVVCYQNQQFNFNTHYTKKLNKNIYFYLIKLKNLFSIKRNVKLLLSIIFILFTPKKKLPSLNRDIIFFISMDPRSQKDLKPILDNFSKKIILIDKPFKMYERYKKIFKNTKIINIREYIQIKDYFFALIKSFNFLKKILIQKNINIHPDISLGIYFNFFLRIEIYKKIIKNIKTDKLFIDRGDGLSSNFFISRFKKYNKNNKVFSYSLNGLALNNDLIFSHYFYSDLDYLFCYGKLDKIFITKLFKRNKFKLLNIPNKIIPVGSVRNFSYKISKIKRKLNVKKKKFNFLYIKSNPTIYDNLDAKCFEKFCLFVNKNISGSQILVKEKLDGISKLNNTLIKKKIINKKNIYSSVNIVPEELFQKTDFVVGTSSAALAQAIYYDIPLICLDNKVIISSFLKFFCSIYVEHIDEIEKYKKKIIYIGNNSSPKNKGKKIIFKEVNRNPYLKILDIIKK